MKMLKQLLKYLVGTLLIGGILSGIIANYSFKNLEKSESAKDFFQFIRLNWIFAAFLGVMLALLSWWLFRLSRRAAFLRTWGVHKPVKRLTHQDFRIQKYKEAYITRESDKLIEDLLRNKQHILITGKPKSGKTRSAYEGIKNLTDFHIIKLKPNVDLQKLETELVKVHGKFILFIDDLEVFIANNIDDVVDRALKAFKDLVVVATCRTGHELNLVKDRLLPLYREFNAVELSQVSEADGERLANESGLEWKQGQFDGTPGSITLDLEDMKKRYLASGDGKIILRALKLLKEGNLSYRSPLIQVVCRDILKLPAERLDRYIWDETVSSLKTAGFISTMDDEWYIYPSYLETCVSDYEPRDDLSRLQEVLSETKDSRGLYNLGNSFSYYKKDFRRARECFLDSLSINPGYAQTNTALGYVLVNLGIRLAEDGKQKEAEELFKDAEKHYIEAIRIAPLHVGARASLGYLLVELKRYEEAEKELRRAIKIQPGYAEAHNNLSYLLTHLGRYAEAEVESRESIKLKPLYAQAHANLGYVLSAMKRREEAEAEYREALEIKPDYVEARINLGSLLVESHRLEEAVGEFKQALKLRPGSIAMYIKLGHQFANLKHYDEADQVFSNLIRQRPNNAQAHLNFGCHLVNRKKFEEAERELRKAIRLKPDYAEAYTSLGYLMTYLEKFDEAEKIYKRTLEIAPDHAEAYANYGFLLESRGRHDGAERAFKMALKHKPDYADVHANLGYLLVKMKRYEEAEKEYRKAIEIDSGHAMAYTSLGWLLASKLERLEEAEEQYRKAIALSPERPELRTNFGYLLKQMGRFEEAEKELKEAIRIKPDHAEAHAVLGPMLKLVREIHDYKNLEERVHDYKNLEEQTRHKLSIAPASRKTRLRLALSLEKQRKEREAEAEYLTVLQMHPYNAEASTLYSYFLIYRRRYEEAEKVLRDAIKHNQDNPREYLLLTRHARLLIRLESLDEAKEELLKAIEKKPRCAESHKVLGILWEKLGGKESDVKMMREKYSEAEKEYKIALDIAPNDDSTNRHLGNVLTKLERYEEAGKAYQRAKSLSRTPKNNRDYGIFLHTIGKVAEAREEFESAITLFKKQGLEAQADHVEILIKNLEHDHIKQQAK